MRKVREPQYSFGVKKDLRSKTLGPGPGAYQLNNVFRYGVANSPAYSLGQRTFFKSKKIFLYVNSPTKYNSLFWT